MIKLRVLPLAGVLLFTTTLAGHTPAAQASPENRAVVRDARGNPVRDARGDCVRSSSYIGTDQCDVVQERVAYSARHSYTEDERTVYFNFDKSNLTADARNRLNSLTKALKADEQVKAAHIVGFADRIGSEEYNERLSKRRAVAVKDYLVGQGLVNTDVTETRWVGENAPSTQCDKNLGRSELISCLARDRKVEVEVEYYPDNHQASR
ncbi:MAG: hypothetical protein EB060_04525 [Proteobacteria bacterium]|nr:hypothetical protein [Pseudomonadota bacterium]